MYSENSHKMIVVLYICHVTVDEAVFSQTKTILWLSPVPKWQYNERVYPHSWKRHSHPWGNIMCLYRWHNLFVEHWFPLAQKQSKRPLNLICCSYGPQPYTRPVFYRYFSVSFVLQPVTRSIDVVLIRITCELSIHTNKLYNMDKNTMLRLQQSPKSYF